jgi:hypothetical protein
LLSPSKIYSKSCQTADLRVVSCIYLYSPCFSLHNILSMVTWWWLSGLGILTYWCMQECGV